MIAIIPARGGSKGLPGKNIKLLNGKPLIAYTIEAALNAKMISRVIVSTDDEDIANVSLKYGAEIPYLRPDYLATDQANSIDVYRNLIETLFKIENTQINEFVVLQPTSPLRNFNHIDEAIQLFITKKADSVISYCKEDHPIFWHKFVTEEGKFQEIFTGDYIKNRQEIKSSYYPNGAIYIFKTKIILDNQYYTENSFAYIMSRKFSIDIDTQYDFDMASFILNRS